MGSDRGDASVEAWIESLDASKAIYRLIKYAFHEPDAEREEKEESDATVHVLDLKTLTGVLTGEVYTFATACEVFGVPTSRSRKPRTRVTKPAIESLLKDVTAELELLNRLNEEFKRHNVDVAPERCYSAATLAKAQYTAMGIVPPEQKFKILAEIQGMALQATSAGRAECTIRRTPLPVTYLDFHAQFSAVNSLLGCHEILCAERLEFADFTAGARQIVNNVEIEDCLRPESWRENFRCLVLAEPNEDVVPVRAKFGQREDADPTLGWNFLSSKEPIWITGADAVAAKLISGKPIKILRAIEVIPHGVQPGLVPIKLFSQLTVDPHKDNLAVKLIELRHQLKKKNPKLAGGIKVAANSAAFGILLERSVRDIGGHIAAMDTDSAMIVSTKDGGLIPCAGGPHKLDNYELPAGNDAIHALSWDQVDAAL